MLTVILIWLYVIFTTYLVGYGVLTSLINLPGAFRDTKSKAFKSYSVRFRESYLITGVCAITVYAEIVSLFGKVGLTANLILTHAQRSRTVV